MSDPVYAYPFDPTGTAETNLVVRERHTINPPDYTDYYFIVPFVGPFFENNLQIQHFPSGKILVKGEDYLLGYRFLSASRATANQVWGAISLLGRELTGVLEVTYQTLGGDWTINEAIAAEMLANVMSNPRRTSWEQIHGPMQNFPVIDHEWNLVDMVGMSEVNLTIRSIAETIEAASGATINNHLNDINNPHNVTKAQVGLGLVQNFPIASAGEAAAGTSNERYMTPLRTAAMIQALSGNDITTHATDMNNPHAVTKTQVGLGNVDNYSTATDNEARDGLRNDRFITPRGAALLIGQLVAPGIGDHMTDLTNPHQVTASQVGLGNVPNWQIPTNAIAISGNSMEHFMTPHHTKLLVGDMALNPLSIHMQRTDNPHSVTKAHVGLELVDNFATASVNEAIDGTRTDRFLTPYGARLTIETLIGSALDNHIGRTDNPHSVTKAHVGLELVDNFATATDNEAIDGTRTDRFLTPYGARLTIETLIGSALDNHIDRTDNPHNVTAEQIGAVSLDTVLPLLEQKMDITDTIQNALMLENTSLSQIYAYINNQVQEGVADLTEVWSEQKIFAGGTEDQNFWKMIAYSEPNSDLLNELIDDLDFQPFSILVSGCDDASGVSGSVELVSVNWRGTVTGNQTSLTAIDGPEFGIINNPAINRVELWVKLPPRTNNYTITRLSLDDPFEFSDSDIEPLEAEPSGYQVISRIRASDPKTIVNHLTNGIDAAIASVGA
jgi:hypothetical protein